MTRSYTLSEPARARRAAQKHATRAALLEAARAIAAERGVEAISVVEVARRAGVSHSLINAYFDGVIDILWKHEAMIDKLTGDGLIAFWELHDVPVTGGG